MKAVFAPTQQSSASNSNVAVLRNLKTGATVLLNKAETTVGSSARSDVAVERDSMVASEHAVLRNSFGVISIQILASNKGTWKNGWPIGHSVKLKDGDEIRLGSTRFAVYC